MEKEDLREIIIQVVKEDILPLFLQMLSASEGRIDKTNTMIERFAECTDKMTSLMDDLATNYKEQFMALGHSREVAQDNNTELIKANMDMQVLMASNRDDHREQLGSYRKELHSAKERCNKLEAKLERLEEKHESLLDRYIKMSEGIVQGSRQTTEVNIQNK